MYHYAGNSPVRYIDPDGREIAFVAIFLSGLFFVTIFEVYLLSPVGQRGIEALSNVITNGVQDVAATVCNVLSAVKTNSQEKRNPRLLYRAVDQYESDSIIGSGGKFSMGDNSTYEAGKLFQTKLADAYGYAELANSTIAKANPYVAIVSTTDPTNSAISINSIIDAPSAVIIPAEKLPLLTPAVILPLED